jgi:hypothetical protein
MIHNFIIEKQLLTNSKRIATAANLRASKDFSHEFQTVGKQS